MDNDSGLPNEPIAGPSGVAPQRNKASKRDRRARSKSTSSSSSNSRSSSSTSRSESSQDSRKRKRKSHRHRSKKQKRDRRLLEKLTKEVGKLRKNIVNKEDSFRDNESFISDVSRELYNDCYASQPFLNSPVEEILPNLSFQIETKTKDPAVPTTPEEYLKMLSEVQRFGSRAWSEVRYFETQKLYNHSPGFTDLETNEEVKAYDKIRHLAYSDKSYAAITFGILKQKEVFLKSCRNLLAWSKSPDASLNNLDDKIDEFFLKGDFHKVSTDLLQMACGHRAETIEMRRDGILKCVRDPLIKCKLEKIPPSNTHVFEQDALTATIETAGGIRKAFWPANQSSGGNASRAKSTNAARLPSRGNAHYNVPSHGTSEPGWNMMPCAHTSCSSNQPSQGGCQSQFSSRGHHNAHQEPRYQSNNRSVSFRSRRSGPRPSTQRGHKRPYSPSGNRGGKRQRQ